MRQVNLFYYVLKHFFSQWNSFITIFEIKLNDVDLYTNIIPCVWHAVTVWQTIACGTLLRFEQRLLPSWSTIVCDKLILTWSTIACDTLFPSWSTFACCTMLQYGQRLRVAHWYRNSQRMRVTHCKCHGQQLRVIQILTWSTIVCETLIL